jgi:predicted amidohydrolase
MAEKTLRIAAAQLKFRRTLPENVDLVCRFIADAAQIGSDVVLFPECALTGYNVDFEKLSAKELESGLGTVADAARSHACHVLVGSPTFMRGPAIQFACCH